MKIFLSIIFFSISIYGSSIAQTIIKINKAIQYQQIDGFGVLATDHSSKVVAENFPPTKPMRDTLADLLVNDLGLTIFRNYLEPEFELVNDNNDPNVLDLPKFNLQNKVNTACDGDAFMPVEITKNTFLKLKNLVKKNGDSAIFITSIASPPKWMKYNNCANGTDFDYNRLITSEENAKIKPAGISNNDYKEEFAEFCEAYLQYMKQEGISIHGLSIQNNPYFGQPYSSCVYRDSSYIATLNKVGQRIVNKKFETNLLFNEDIIDIVRFKNFMKSFAINSEANKFKKIAAIQGYQTGGIFASSISPSSFNSMQKIFNNYDPTLKIYSTEAGDEFFPVNIINSLKHGKVSAWLYFSPIYSPDYGGLLNNDLSKKYNYQVLKHFSKNINQGAIQVACEATENDLYSVAFQHNKNKTLTIVLVNDNPTESKTVKLSFDESQQVPKYFAQVVSQQPSIMYQSKGIIANTDLITLPPQSIVTIIGEESGMVAANNAIAMTDLNYTAFYNSETNEIVVNANLENHTTVTVRDIHSKIVYETTIPTGNSNLKIDASSLANGLYTCQINEHCFKLKIMR
jgi:O-glycosyl hydrolase